MKNWIQCFAIAPNERNDKLLLTKLVVLGKVHQYKSNSSWKIQSNFPDSQDLEGVQVSQVFRKFFFLSKPRNPTKIEVQMAKSSLSSILTCLYISFRCSTEIGRACSGALASFLFSDCRVNLSLKESLSNGKSRTLWRNPMEPIAFLICSYPDEIAISSAKRIISSTEAGRMQRPKKMEKKSHCLMWLMVLRAEFLA